METYREKIVKVQAVQWQGQNSGEVDELAGWTDGHSNSWILPNKEGLMVKSIDGNVKVPIGHYIVKCKRWYTNYQLEIFSEEKFDKKYENYKEE